MAKRIDETLLPSNYVNGQKIYGADMNKIVSLLRDGVNYNKSDIDKLLQGEDSDYVFESEDAMNDWLLETTPADGQVCFVLVDTTEKLKMFKYSSATSSWVSYGDFSLLLMFERMLEIEEDLWDRSYSSVWFTGTAITGTTAGIVVTSSLIGDPSLNDFYMNSDTSNVYICVGVGETTSTWDYVQNIQGGAIRMRGAWNTNTSYYYSNKYQDIVSYGGATYYCKQTITTTGNLAPIDDSVHWGVFMPKATAFRARGEWVGGTEYFSDIYNIDVVTYLGDTYYCKVSNTSTTAPIDDATHWGVYTEKGISFRVKGAWTSESSYYNNNDWIDVVTYLGKAYACKVTVESIDSEPPSTDTEHWELFVDNTMGLSLDSESTSISHTLENNLDKSFSYSNINSYTIVIPATTSHGFISEVNFLVGPAPTQVVFTNNSGFTLKLIRYGLPVASYTPTAGKVSKLLFECDGLFIYCYIVEV